MVRGKNNIAIESDCSWATPKDTFSNYFNQIAAKANLIVEHNSTGSHRPLRRQSEIIRPANRTRIPSPRHLSIQRTLPAGHDWRDVNGVNYLSWNRNQNNPQYCGSGWAHATTSAMADRFNIKFPNLSPAPVDISLQVLLNCGAGGNCDGGFATGVYEHMHTKHGVIQNYLLSTYKSPGGIITKQVKAFENNFLFMCHYSQNLLFGSVEISRLWLVVV